VSIFTKSDLPPAPEPVTAEDVPITEAPPDDGLTPARPGQVRRIAAWVLTVLAGLFVFVALVAPDQHTRLTLGSFVRIPVEGLIGAALLLVLPGRARKIVAALIGVFLGLLILVQALDFGFWKSLNRQFDLVADWGLLDDGVAFLRDAVGRTGANIAVAGAVVLAIAVVVFMALSMVRLSRIAAGHRTGTAYGIAVLAVAWVACAVLGAQFVSGVPVAAHSEADLVHNRALMVQAGLRDKKAFAAAIAADKFHDTRANQLLTGLRGKDVIVSYVESYGRSALEDPQQAAIVDPALAAGTQQLKAAGFSARSGFLTSSTFGGYSWLAHSTFQSGLLINGQQRYRTLVSTDRLTLTSAFRRAGWQTVAVEPDNTYAWPEGDFYGYERVYDSRNLGYTGPHFGWSTMPDQYTLSQFQRREYGKPHAPLMAEITLTSSHTPWAPIPQLVDWNAIGNGAIYGAQQKAGNSPESVWKDSNKVRTEYAKSIAYSVGSLVSWAEKYGNDNLVLIFFGDHQASSIVSGKNATHDVPITIVAHDPAVLDKISAWGWQDGLRPSPQAPVMPMEAFRDRFLATFGSQPTER
jgi:Sulfatase